MPDHELDAATRAFYEADPIIDTNEITGADVPRPWDSLGDRYQDHLRGLVRVALSAAAAAATELRPIPQWSRDVASRLADTAMRAGLNPIEAEDAIELGARFLAHGFSPSELDEMIRHTYAKRARIAPAGL